MGRLLRNLLNLYFAWEDLRSSDVKLEDLPPEVQAVWRAIEAF